MRLSEKQWISRRIKRELIATPFRALAGAMGGAVAYILLRFIG